MSQKEFFFFFRIEKTINRQMLGLTTTLAYYNHLGRLENRETLSNHGRRIGAVDRAKPESQVFKSSHEP